MSTSANTPERSEVRWGHTDIPYLIRRSDRRGTVGIAVEPSGDVVLTAPQAATAAGLDRLVRSKAKWIVDRLRHRETLPPPRMREFISGEGFSYLGKQYRLRLLPGKSVRPIALRSGHLDLPIPSDLDAEHQAAYVQAALADWYAKRARQRLPEWTQTWAAKAGHAFSGLLVADQEKRWGSCSNGVLRFNWRLLQAPRALVDYVLAHEVVHLAHENHDAAFWAALGRILPDYEARKERLRKLGPDLIW